MAIDAILCHKLLMGALLDDLAVIDYEDPVGIAHGFQPVGDHDDCLYHLRAAGIGKPGIGKSNIG